MSEIGVKVFQVSGDFAEWLVPVRIGVMVRVSMFSVLRNTLVLCGVRRRFSL